MAHGVHAKQTKSNINKINKLLHDTRAKDNILPHSLVVHTEIAYSSRSTDSMHVLLDVSGQVKVDDVLHVCDVKTPCCHLAWTHQSSH